MLVFAEDIFGRDRVRQVSAGLICRFCWMREDDANGDEEDIHLLHEFMNADKPMLVIVKDFGEIPMERG